jgi:hypothetical protein
MALERGEIMKRTLAALLLAGILAGCAAQTSTPGAAAAPKRTDAELTSAMLGNIAYSYATSDWYPYLLTDGTNLDLNVTDQFLVVATLLTDATQAASICSSIAAITNDSETAQPLGISGVDIISGGKKLAGCKP